jgi:hypothetical protein
LDTVIGTFLAAIFDFSNVLLFSTRIFLCLFFFAAEQRGPLPVLKLLDLFSKKPKPALFWR